VPKEVVYDNTVGLLDHAGSVLDPTECRPVTFVSTGTLHMYNRRGPRGAEGADMSPFAVNIHCTNMSMPVWSCFGPMGEARGAARSTTAFVNRRKRLPIGWRVFCDVHA
jgi:hypothetical protein